MKGSKALAIALCIAGIVAVLHFRPAGKEGPVVDTTDDVRACVERLRAIHAALVEHDQAHGTLPRGGPVAFRDAVAEVDPSLPFACPAGTGYAVRDLAAHPLPSFPANGSEPILACDDVDGMTHDGAVNVLFADRSVRTILLDAEVAAGRLPAGTTSLRAGPDSPLPVLRRLRVD